jgi:hypothetical protein
VREAIVSRIGDNAGRKVSGTAGAALDAKQLAEQEGKRSPELSPALRAGASVSLSFLAYNIKRVINIMGVPKMIEALG